MATAKKVLIVGGGIAGLTLACALQQVGVTARVIESGKRSDRLGTGISLLGNALRALDRIDLADACLTQGTGYDRVLNRDSEGCLISEFNSPRTFRADKPGACGIMRPVLGDLLEGAALRAGATIDYTTTLTEFEQRSDGVRATLSSGEVVEADIVAACDGVYSRTRKEVFGAEHRAAYCGQGGWRYTTDRPADMSGMTFYVAPDGRRIGCIPLSAEKCYYFILENQAEAPRMPAEKLGEMFRARMAGFDAPELIAARDRIDEAAHISFRPFDILLMPEPWRRGRVVLVGDAAHSLTPQLTSGGGMAVEDAVVLAEELMRAADLDGALDDYSKRRAARVTPIYDISYRICRAEQDPGADKQLSMALLKQGHELVAGPF